MRGREARPKVWEGSGEVGRPTRRSRRGQEANLENRAELGGPSVGPGEVGRPTRRFVRGLEACLEVCRVQEADPDVWEVLGSHPKVWKGSVGLSGGPSEVWRPTWWSRWERVPPGGLV